MSHRERPLCSDRSLRAVARVGQAVNLAVERFVTVGETIADGNPEIRDDMYQACKRARDAGEFTFCSNCKLCKLFVGVQRDLPRRFIVPQLSLACFIKEELFGGIIPFHSCKRDRFCQDVVKC